jgi:hypothetical protein
MTDRILYTLTALALLCVFMFDPNFAACPARSAGRSPPRRWTAGKRGCASFLSCWPVSPLSGKSGGRDEQPQSRAATGKAQGTAIACPRR